MTRATRETGGRSRTSNVLAFQAPSENDRLLRQRAIREHLVSLACDNTDSPIAAAVAILQSDGTVKISARGIDPDIAMQMSDALDGLSNTVRMHALAPRRRPHQGGFVNISFALMLGFIAADFINQVAWIDAALMLAAQLIASYLARRIPRPEAARAGKNKHFCPSPDA